MHATQETDRGNSLVAVYSHNFFLHILEPWQPDPQYQKFPGGGIEPGETPLQAGIREVLEETGILLRPNELRFIRAIERPARSGGHFFRHFFVAKISDRRIRAHARYGDEGEIVRLVPFRQWNQDLHPDHAAWFREALEKTECSAL